MHYAQKQIILRKNFNKQPSLIKNENSLQIMYGVCAHGH
jgi:hypothetical protein